MSIHEKTANVWIVNRGYCESLSAQWLIFNFDERKTYRQFYEEISSLLDDVCVEQKMRREYAYDVLEYVSNLTADDLGGLDQMSTTEYLWEMMIPNFTKESVIATMMHGRNFFEERCSFYVEFEQDGQEYVDSLDVEDDPS
jgi:hypothetical protein